MRATMIVYCCGLLGTGFAQLPSAGLVAFLPFHQSTQDSSGSGNHAIAGGCTYATDRFGEPGSALALNGTTDSLRMPLPGFTPLTGDFTIAFWLKTSSPEKLNVLSLKETPDDTTENFEVQFNNIYRQQTILEIYYGSFTYWNGTGIAGNVLAEGSPGRYYNGKWHHYAIRRSGDSLQWWHDRVLYTETMYGGTLGDAVDLVVGAAPHRLEGAIDDIACYDRALTTAEMHQVYHDRKPFEFRSPSSTDAYVQGDTAAVFWLWDASAVSDSVDLEYRLNGIGTWLPTGQNQLVDWTPHPFPMTFPMGTAVELRLRDRLDTNISTTTGPFIVSEYAWEEVNPDLPFTNRDGSGLLTFNGRMWLLGGWDPPFHEPNYTHSEVWSTTDGLDWTFHGEAPWMGRHVSGWQVHDDAIWVIGGDPQSGSLSDVWRSEDGENWTQVLDAIPGLLPLRTMHMTASLGGVLLNFGGQPATYVPENLDQVWSSPDGATWTQLPNAPWKPRGMVLGSCVDENDTLWLLGGGRLWDRRCYNDVWKTGDGVAWEQVTASAPWAPRYWHNVAWFDHRMWVICGGVNNTDNDETWYSADGIAWHELKNPKYAARHAASVATHNDALWLMTGIASNDCWRLRNVTAAPTVFNEPFAERPRIHPNPTLGAVIAPFDVIRATVRTTSGSILAVPFSGRTLDLSALPAGIYVLSLTLRDASQVNERVVKY